MELIKVSWILREMDWTLQLATERAMKGYKPRKKSLS